ncbi:Beta-1,3-glucosyltransferase [Bulinus truncatus]|nr:Beta-1,3-glucosyltransferase [Bulinus truncatus]
MKGFATIFIRLLSCEKEQILPDKNASDILIIVLSQPNDFHVKEAEAFRKHFNIQLDSWDQSARPQLLLTHEHLTELHGSWTIFPLLEKIISLTKNTELSWVFICEEDTRIDIGKLVELLQSKNTSEHHFLGRELRDHEATIIHHFAFVDKPSKFAYPDFRAGFVLSIALVRNLYERLKTGKLKVDFSIDPKHEFALFVWNDGRGPSLLKDKGFCSVDQSSSSHCITKQLNKFPDCGVPVKREELFVAVKTCAKFHKSRIPVVQATWGRKTEFIEYYSDVEDTSIPTISLGVPNTERGHCGKTMAIIRRVANSETLSSIPWLLVADDDTIINLDRLRSLLACYNPHQPVALGERYGYALARGGGYDYITGGGGMVFSQSVVKVLSSNCRCYTDDSPDDMTLGMCLKSAGVPVTHSRFFHQARPDDYSRDFLSNQLPVSFHKHWSNDPYKVYADLTSPDVKGYSRVKQKQHTRVEL